MMLTKQRKDGKWADGNSNGGNRDREKGKHRAFLFPFFLPFLIVIFLLLRTPQQQ
jgi:hypothetical protein